MWTNTTGDYFEKERKKKNWFELPFCRTGMMTDTVLLAQLVLLCRTSCACVITDACVCPGAAFLQTGTPNRLHNNPATIVRLKTEKKLTENKHRTRQLNNKHTVVKRNSLPREVARSTGNAWFFFFFFHFKSVSVYSVKLVLHFFIQVS